MAKRWEPGRYEPSAYRPRDVTPDIGLHEVFREVPDADMEELKARFTEQVARAHGVPLWMVLDRGVTIRRRPWWRRRPNLRVWNRVEAIGTAKSSDGTVTTTWSGNAYVPQRRDRWWYLRIRLVTDKSLVDKWCIHVTTRGWDRYWFARATSWWRLRYTKLEREAF